MSIPLPCVCFFGADKTSISAGEAVVLTWITDDATEVLINGIKQHALCGSVTVNPQYDTEYILQASSWLGASNSCPICITVSELDPASIPGLKIWWDFSDNGTITQSAGAVSAVTDKSGNGYDLAQTDPGLQPVIAEAGSGDLLEQSVQITAPNLFEIVTQYDTNAVGNSLFYVTSQIADCDPYVLIDSANLQLWSRELGSFIYYNNGSGVGHFDSPSPALGPHQYTSLMDVVNPTTSVFRDGGVNLSVTVEGSPVSTLSFNKMGYTANNYYAEVLVFDRKLNLQEMIQVEMYLRIKWGLPS